MKGRFSVVLLLVMLFIGVENLSAQVRKWEVELGAGCVIPSDQLRPMFDNEVGFNIQTEVRYNFGMVPVDLGLHVDGNLFKREWKSISDIKFMSYNAMAVADLNLLRNKKVQVFVGCGLGYGWLAKDVENIGTSEDVLDALDKTKDAWHGKSALMAMPRIGIEAWHHLRATIYYKAPADKTLIKEQGHFGVSLGLVIGGGLKNKVKKAE